MIQPDSELLPLTKVLKFLPEVALKYYQENKILLVEYFQDEKKFEQAYKLYNDISKMDVKGAYLYKLNALKEIETQYRKVIAIVSLKMQSLSNSKMLKQRSTTEIETCIDNKLSEIATQNSSISMQEVITLINNPAKNLKDLLCKAVGTLIAENVIMFFTLPDFKELIDADIKKFFKSKHTYTDLKTSGIVYNPEQQHSWGGNLSWVLAHIKKGNMLFIRSDILANEKRTSEGKESEYSAFIREICVALKAGYILLVTRDDIILSAERLSHEHLQQLDSTGVPGNGVDPSSEEINLMFHGLERVFDPKQLATYTYNAGNIEKSAQEVFSLSGSVSSCTSSSSFSRGTPSTTSTSSSSLSFKVPASLTSSSLSGEPQVSDGIDYLAECSVEIKNNDLFDDIQKSKGRDDKKETVSSNSQSSRDSFRPSMLIAAQMQLSNLQNVTLSCSKGAGEAALPILSLPASDLDTNELQNQNGEKPKK